VNFLGHAQVALAAGEDTDFVLGAVLPDLAPMAGIRLRRAGIGGRLGEGIACHVRADAAFHALVEFRRGSGALRRDLAARGLGTGPARAVGHAGWELLLDGTLVGGEAEDAFHRALSAGHRVGDALDQPDRARWEAFLTRGRGRGHLRYDDPAWVADRLHAMLGRRPRLALADADVPTVADVLAAHVPAVAAVAGAVVAATAAAATGAQR
jgi:hypothetical protein